MFYVIHLNDLTQTSHDDIEAKVDLPAHGKLLWDEDPNELGNRGFATSTGESFLFEIDMKLKAQTASYNYSSFVDGCPGLHAIAYSGINNHIYAECVGVGGIIEFDVSDGTIEFVHQHMNASGALYETPNGDMVVASNKGENLLHVFIPNESGVKSSLEYDIPMPGNPSTVSFYDTATMGGEHEIIVCAPLTENLNQNQRREDDGTVVCDAYNGCTGAVTADDVNHGVCLHDAVNEDTGQQTLLRVTEEVSSADDMPACARCTNSTNFNFEEEGTGTLSCVCTPNCGLCDPQPEFSDDESGYVCINLSAYIAGTVSEPTVITNAGGMIQGEPFGGSAECSFGHTYRPHKRGMQYDASIATIPTDSIIIINMYTMEKTCQVDLPGTPSRVLYAPATPVGLNDEPSQSGASTSSYSLLLSSIFDGPSSIQMMMMLSMTIFLAMTL